MRLGNMATLAREWAAVQRVPRLAFKRVLLSGKMQQHQGKQQQLQQARQLHVPPALMEHLKQQYNESQLSALTSGLDNRPFVLIQGPPGTGKTQCASEMPANGAECGLVQGLSSSLSCVNARPAVTSIWLMTSDHFIGGEQSCRC